MHRRELAEDAVASLLRVVWEKDEAGLRADSAAFKAFQSLLACLTVTDVALHSGVAMDLAPAEAPEHRALAFRKRYVRTRAGHFEQRVADLLAFRALEDERELARGLRGDEGDVRLVPGRRVSIAVAVWDGSAEDRNGQKSISIWQGLTLQE